ncbi:rhodanese-like domain-containing protein [Coxiella endosymbiont of Amblyomma nuttalli]|uniref:rhodanese-like domain-containing protein n=1 Tax=Coxiella endosymbiont of Amblyomma nuttalli TaxID=2749996 RepID=UPI001BB634EA|nr:rhodanese-like domain-containing protein [Coxiella endosymbiont of Amblyomma nuttalli]QTS83640.1 Thiosulfate sulfurtransferase GlpE [Coxiella endosymbiont of Amblyomma nuttalli]
MMEQISQFIVNHWALVMAFVSASVVLFIIESRSKGLSGRNRLTPFQATRLINSEEAIVIDIRDANAYNKGHIANAIHISLKGLDESMEHLEQYKRRPLIIVCAMGQKLGRIINMLREHGYKKIYILTGGMNAWNNANMPVTKNEFED